MNDPKRTQDEGYPSAGQILRLIQKLVCGSENGTARGIQYKGGRIVAAKTESRTHTSASVRFEKDGNNTWLFESTGSGPGTYKYLPGPWCQLLSDFLDKEKEEKLAAQKEAQAAQAAREAEYKARGFCKTDI